MGAAVVMANVVVLDVIDVGSIVGTVGCVVGASLFVRALAPQVTDIPAPGEIGPGTQGPVTTPP